MCDRKQKSVIIIGAGVGGVASAARLAQAGFKVTVIEKNDFTGGRCSLIEHGGYRFDRGPSLLLLPQLFHSTFADLGTSLSAEGITLIKCEPNYTIHFHDNTSISLSTSLSSMHDLLTTYEGPSGFLSYLRFLHESSLHYSLSVQHVLQKPFDSIWAMLRPSFLRHLWELHPFESIYGRAAKYFRTERMRRVFTFASMYMGMSPFDAPGTYSLLQNTELVEGIWYPVGGFHMIVQALVDIGKRHGATYRLSTSISQILLSADQSQATGVLLSTGERLHADIILCNADLVYAYNNLLPPTNYATSLSTRPASCSSISFYWSLDKKIPSLSTHNVFLAEQYRESFDSIFKEHRLPNEPSFYVNVPSRVDPSAAPEGKDTLVVLVPTGHLHPSSSALEGESTDTGTQDWHTTISHLRTQILSIIQSRLHIDLHPHIVHESLHTPVTWKSVLNLDRGAILGLSHSFFNVLSFRPRTKHAGIRGLYFVGASTHPGTGVPIVLAGAKMVVERIMGDLGMRGGSVVEGKGKRDGKRRGDVSELDRMRWGWWDGALSWMLVLFIAMCIVLFMNWAGVGNWKGGITPVRSYK